MTETYESEQEASWLLASTHAMQKIKLVRDCIVIECNHWSQSADFMNE